MYTCPVCAYPRLRYTPTDFTICPCCGTEFGYHDASRTFEQLRFDWISAGLLWHSRVIQPPPNWSGVEQLFVAGYLPLVNRPRKGSVGEKKVYSDGLRLDFVGA